LKTGGTVVEKEQKRFWRVSGTLQTEAGIWLFREIADALYFVSYSTDWSGRGANVTIEEVLMSEQQFVNETNEED